MLTRGMGNLSETWVFWILVFSATLFVVSLWLLIHNKLLRGRGKELTWDIHTEFIDVSEFSNRNIPLKVTYKGTEPRWLWATYLTLCNSGTTDISSDDTPERQGFVVGAEGCRYIGFNKLVSDKAKVVLKPLFKGSEGDDRVDVSAKIEFDRLGPGDEILVSLLFIADERRRVGFQGKLFGANSMVRSGYELRMAAWRSIWWLIIGAILAGGLTGWAVNHFLYSNSDVLVYQLAALLVIYFIALATAAVLLRPIYNWQQLLDRFGEPGYRRDRSLKQLRYLFWLEREV